MMPEMPSELYFRDVAKYYDLFGEWPDEPFFKEMANRYGSPILELGSGTGRISILLAEAGYKIVGIDLSHEMMEIARGKLDKLPKAVRSRVTFHYGDITDFNLNRDFPLIIIPSSFKFLLTIDAQLACLRCVRDHLQSTGAFILDLYPGEASGEDGSETTTHEVTDGTILTFTVTYSNDLNSKLRNWKICYEFTHPSDEVERIETQMTTALITPRDGERLLELTGLKIVEEYGGWDFSPYKSDSWRRVLVLQKGF
jgi:SAM-dependent methyltransferase